MAVTVGPKTTIVLKPLRYLEKKSALFMVVLNSRKPTSINNGSVFSSARFVSYVEVNKWEKEKKTETCLKAAAAGGK